MIKAKHGDTMILGLSDENIERLKNGQPIKFNMSALGFPAIEVLIFNGKNEQTMKKELIDIGLIHPTKTIIQDSNADKN